MGLINLILDLAGVLLWFQWRSLRNSRQTRILGVSLLATLKRAESRHTSPGSPLLGLFILLLFRSFFYWHLVPATDWVPSLGLGALSLPFRSDFLNRMLLFSLLSFLLTLGAAYLWLLLISMAIPKGSENDPLFRWIRNQLGWISRWPLAARLALPWMGGTGLWYAIHPLLVMLGLLLRPESPGFLWKQSLLLGLGTYLAWESCIVVVLGLYLINSYVYLGNYAFWTSINTIANTMLSPLSWLPLRMGPLDLRAPLAITGVILLAELGRGGISLLHQKLLL